MNKLHYLLIPFFFHLQSSQVTTYEQLNKSLHAKDHFIVKMKGQEPKGTASLLLKYNDARNHEIIRHITSAAGLNVTGIKKIFPPGGTSIRNYQSFQLGAFYKVYIDRYKDLTIICKDIEKDPGVEFAEPDFIGEAAGESSRIENLPYKPNDEFFSRQWGLYNDGTTPTTRGRAGKSGADINAIKGWDITTGSDDVIVGIMDSGVKFNHPDLAGRIWMNPKETRNGIDDDNNGYVDDLYGWNFAYENSNVSDDGGHGTNIAGTIGANTNNTIGYAGVDHKCKLMICKNLDNDNLGEYSWWASSLYYSANNGAKVINMSEGGYDYSKTLKTAVDYAYNLGAIIIASMMNKNNGDSYYPASFKNVLAVGATDSDDGRCKQFTWGGGSNWGKHIAVVAPGNRIYGLDFKDNFNYDVYWSGTSQATAYASGLASLLLAQNNRRTNDDLRKIITSTAKDGIGDPKEDSEGWDEYYGYGRIDIFAALNYDRPPMENVEKKDPEEKKEFDGNAADHQAKASDRNSSNRENDGKEWHQARRADR
jgi:thermitase